MQDTLLKVSGAWRRIRGDGNPVGFATTTMFRTYVSRWRMLRRRPATVPYTEESTATPRDEYAAVEARDTLRRALATLPATQRAVLVLSCLDGAEDAEIGRILSRKPATVRSLRHRGLTALRRQLSAPGPRPTLPPAVDVEFSGGQ